MEDLIVPENTMLVIGIAVCVFVAALCLLGIFIEEAKRDAKRRAELQRHRDRQNEEWERQLQENPWLRNVLDRAQRQQETITYDMRVYLDRYGHLRCEVVRPRPEPQERVNWKQDGF